MEKVTEEKQYFPADMRFFAAGRNHMFVLNKNSAKVFSVSRQEGLLLHSLFGCRSLNEHLNLLLSTGFFGDDVQSLSELLLRWMDYGLLRPEKNLSSANEIRVPAVDKARLVTDYSDSKYKEVLKTVESLNLNKGIEEAAFSGLTGQRNIKILTASTESVYLYDIDNGIAAFSQSKNADLFVFGVPGYLRFLPQHETSETFWRQVDSGSVAGLAAGAVRKVRDGGIDLSSLPGKSAEYMESGKFRIGAVLAGTWGKSEQLPLYQAALMRVHSEQECFETENNFSGSPGCMRFISAPEGCEILHEDFPLNHSILLLDASLSLPPFYTGCIGGSYGYLNLLSAIHPEAAALQLPLASGNYNAEPFAVDPHGLTIPGEILEGLIAKSILPSITADTAPVRLEEAGNRYMELAGFSEEKISEFQNNLKRQYVREQAGLVAYQLEYYDNQPGWWCVNLKEYIGACKAIDEDPAIDKYLIPREILGSYGKLLLLWPELRHRVGRLTQAKLK